MPDDYWHLVNGIELYSDLNDDGDHRRLGMVLARAHGSGWFFSAHHRPRLLPEELIDLAEFAKVRAYLLLTHGPTPTTWIPRPGSHEWLAWSFADEPDAATAVPDAVPASWW